MLRLIFSIQENACHELLNIIVIPEIPKRIVSKRFLHFDEIKDANLIPFVLKHTTCIAQQLAFWIGYNKGGIALQQVRHHIAARFSRA